jgi:N-acylneuraminate cytidylyltransferase
MIRLVAFDFDGVFTDDSVYVDQDGREMVKCSRSDGYGIEQLRKTNKIDIIVISREKNPVVIERCRKLKIPCINGVEDKLTILKKEIENRKLSPEEVAFVGNDLSDIECLRYVGLAFCPSNSHPSVKRVFKIKTTYTGGGNGAVRDICEYLMEEIK